MKVIRISEAKRNFGGIFARAKKGETIILQNVADFMQLVPCALPDPVPLRPVGYFQASDEEIVRINASPTDSGPLRRKTDTELKSTLGGGQAQVSPR
ncbi:MAG: type II toxin-antitoxin system Phd/YefM family antitoxin [Opitutaceae bacterium]